MNKIQKKMILDLSGLLPLAAQPKSYKDIETSIKDLKRTHPAMYEKCFDIIVNHEINDLHENSKEFNSEIVSTLVSDHLDDFEEGMGARLLNTLNDAIVQIDSSCEKSQKLMGHSAIEIVEKEVEKYKKQFTTIKIKNGDKRALVFDEIICEEFEDLMALANARINIMMVGPSGCGKTHVASQIARSLGLDFSSQSCTSGMSESQLTGWLLPIKDGNFEHVQSEFIKIYENGGVFLFDELDASDPNVLIFINQALANSQFFLPQRFGNTLVKKHKDFIAIGACNTYGGGADSMHTARNALDIATIDRFKMGMISMGYSPAIEQVLVDPNILLWGRMIRHVINKHEIRKIMSTRFMRDATTMLSHGFTMNRIAESFFLDWSEEDISVVEN